MPRAVRVLLLAAAGAFAFRAAPACGQAAPMSVLVDASGSMRGFYATGAIHGLVDALRGAGADRVQVFRYSAAPDGTLDGGLDAFSGTDDEARGGVTLLSRGLTAHLQQARPGEVVVLLTDNIQDAGTLPGERQDVEAFYRLLRQDPRITHVYILPLRRRFTGTLYGRDGVTQIGPYSGERGLVAYLIVHRGGDGARVQALAQAVGGRLHAGAVRMKPYDTAPVEADVDVAATARLSPPAACPSAKPLLPAAGEGGVLERRDRVSEGQPFGGMFVVRLQSRMEGVSLDRPQVHASIPEEFRMSVANVSSDPVVTPNPRQLDTEFAPGDTTSIRVIICFPEGLRFDTARAARKVFERASERAGVFEGRVLVELSVPQRALQLEDALRRDYSVSEAAFFTDTASVYHRRIFGLADAFRVLAPSTVTVGMRVDSRVRFQVNLPLEGVAGKIFTGLAVLLVLLGLLALVGRRGAFVLRDEGAGHFHFARLSRKHRGGGGSDPDSLIHEPAFDHGPELEGTQLTLRWLQSHTLRVDDVPAGVIRSGLTGAGVRALPGFRVNGSLRTLGLHPQGTSFSLTEVDEPGTGANGRGRLDQAAVPSWSDSWDRGSSS